MWNRELTQAAEIAREAGAVVLDLYARQVQVEWKGKGDPVTEADRRANALIVQRLRAAFPDDGIIAEESERTPAELARPRIWYVDPLDGTKEFIARNGEFSVMIGLAVEGRAQLGAVFQPSAGTLYLGELGRGAWVWCDGEQRELHVSELREPSQLGLIVSRSHRPASTELLMQRLGIQRETTSGSVGLKIGQLAQRAADLYVHMSDRSSAWDTCAPEAILHAAGGRFTDLAGEPLQYGLEDVRTRRGILACNSAAFDAVLPVVRELSEQNGLLALSARTTSAR